MRVAPLRSESVDGRPHAVTTTGTTLDVALVEAANRAFAADASPTFAPNLVREGLTLRMTVLAAVQPTGVSSGTDRAASLGRSVLGLSGWGAGGARAGRLEVEGRLYAKDGRELGYARWEHEGAPDELAASAGSEVVAALLRLVPDRLHERTPRRAADERLLLTPTAQTLERGEVVVSDDEVLLARVGVGLSRRLQLDLLAGGLPIPAAVGGGAASHAVVAGGAGGGLVLGFWDLGLKVRVWDEDAWMPGIAASYDLLDLFGLAAGGVGVVFLGDGAGGGGFGAVGGANAQFNLFTLVAAKHFGPAQITLGAFVLDNHHFLPQSAAFQAICAGAVAGGSGGAAGAADCGSGSARLPRLPLRTKLFTGAELVLGPHSSLMAESFWANPIRDSFVTTGARWLLGANRPWGPFALDRVRFRLDVAVLWFYEAAQGGMNPRGAHVLWLPWLGVGGYFL